MFSIKRFDAFGSSSTAGQDSVDTAKLDALNERIQKKRKITSQGSATQPSASGTTTSLPSTSATASTLAATRLSLNIHPSRLNNAPLLRQSVKKANAGAPKEKTKAKQRYLKAKKERRKARIRAAPRKSKDQQASAAADHQTAAQLPEEVALERLAGKSKPPQQDVSADNPSSSEDTDSDSDSEDDSSSESEDESGPPSAPAADKLKEDDESMAVDNETGETNEEKEVKEAKALERFPMAGVKKAVDSKLISSLGLPQGLSNRTVINPTLSRPLPQHASSSKATASAVVDEEMTAAQDEDDLVAISIRADDDFGKVALSDTVRSRLEALGVSEWFAVQVSVIPTLLAQPQSRSLYRPFAPPRDLCVSAPTGSGKTLAYTVPIVEVLRTRQIVRLRALIVLPTRDLVSQVRSTLELVSKGSGLRIGTATGQHSFSHEQSQLMGTAVTDEEEQDAQKESKVDILIATPGRLIDHLDSTPGFTLAHLRFLVIDEADRLLNQSFQEWLRRVLAATEGKSEFSTQASIAQAPFEILSGDAGLGDAASSTLQEEAVPSVQKLLFSATLTRDPAKISALGLRNPHYITVQDSHSAGDQDGERSAGAQQNERFSLPHSLHEHMLITSSADKPFHLLYLLHRPDDLERASHIRKGLCFTKSVDSAARLVKLIEIFEDVRREHGLIKSGGKQLVVKNYSSELKPSDRQRILTQFGQGEIDILVCSDLISRGIDLPSVEHVISYDAPIDPAKYVHRVGRTARAGKHGDAWSLVEEQEARHFKEMVRSIVRQTPIAKIKPKKLKDDVEVDVISEDAVTREMRKLREAYDEALGRMAQFYKNQ